ncbi:hypothetical protein BU14_1094s0004 [Porphyra umbilicalis]|uniref:Uncharacterized protein n=1 Tax=Porphyra umbilicalis TaxID=2786 RepID=A0A1X6NMH7_PORUM|nr:hypothetical protein BU14_1094s0004 [Porphyra umbilicalis]|eukprot:OSX69824.1 hypothetical protein BU14_1094s0004 [Porphyra umbilicalis]
MTAAPCAPPRRSRVGWRRGTGSSSRPTGCWITCGRRSCSGWSRPRGGGDAGGAGGSGARAGGGVVRAPKLPEPLCVGRRPRAGALPKHGQARRRDGGVLPRAPAAAIGTPEPHRVGATVPLEKRRCVPVCVPVAWSHPAGGRPQTQRARRAPPASLPWCAAPLPRGGRCRQEPAACLAAHTPAGHVRAACAAPRVWSPRRGRGGGGEARRSGPTTVVRKEAVPTSYPVSLCVRAETHPSR